MTRRDCPPFERTGGSSLLEFVIVGVVVAILTGFLLHRLDFYRQQAETVAVERTVGILRIALALKVAQLRAQGREDEFETLALKNPIHLLQRPPKNYVGEYFTPLAGMVPAGRWYFDRKQHLLVYIINSQKKFPHGTLNQRIYAVKLLRRNNDFNRPTGIAPVGVVLIRVAG